MDDDGLDLLDAHHRADAAAPGLATKIVVDARIRDAVLAARPDDRCLELLAEFFLEMFLDGDRAFPPQAGSIPQLDPVVVNEKVDRLRADAFQEDAVQPGVFDLGGEVTAHRSGGVAAGQRGLGGEVTLARAGNHQAREWAAGDDELIGRPKRIGAFWNFLEQEIRAKAAPADEIAHHIRRSRFFGYFASRKINT